MLRIDYRTWYRNCIAICLQSKMWKRFVSSSASLILTTRQPFPFPCPLFTWPKPHLLLCRRPLLVFLLFSCHRLHEIMKTRKRSSKHTKLPRSVEVQFTQHKLPATRHTRHSDSFFWIFFQKGDATRVIQHSTGIKQHKCWIVLPFNDAVMFWSISSLLCLYRERNLFTTKQIINVTIKMNLCGRLPGRKFPSSLPL